uniref:Uncharacterized protein n=1 Tax=Anguilla anguilla TaxID=7936 RepID=A0A0E9X9Q0_ANGAN
MGFFFHMAIRRRLFTVIPDVRTRRA